MMPLASLAVVAGALFCGAGCRSGADQSALARDSAALAAREDRLSKRLAQPVDSGTSTAAPLARWVMPPGLSEISGLALTADGRLLAHGDEAARVFEIDYRRGVIVKRFTLGSPTVRGDFEAITTAGARIFLLTSTGVVYEFREGKDGERVPYAVHDTGLGTECEFEGVAFDSTANALVLACKHVAIKSLKGFVVLYRWSLDDRAAPRITQIKVPLAEVVGSNGWKAFYPSDITVDPHTGNYVIVASHQQGLLSLTRDGVVLFSRPLPEGHAMAEGVAITRDSLLIISDEATRTPAAVTLYRWP